jgi:D-alanine-D-alanine ligase
MQEKKRGSMKKEIAVLFGGISTEHGISIISARSVAHQLDSSKYSLHLIGIDRQGLMQVFTLKELDEMSEVQSGDIHLRFCHQGSSHAYFWKDQFFPIDVVFPVLHGLGGEDGWIQGYFDTLGIPYVGSNVEGSSICMNKSVTKAVLKNSTLEQVPFAYYFSNTPVAQIIEDTLSSFSFPVFVKPSHGGSSIGISKCKRKEDLEKCIENAFSFDREIIIEQGIQGREIECSVLGGYKDIRASMPGEIIPLREFYNYEAKYIEASTKLVIPAQLPSELIKKIQEQACYIFQHLRCYGMARVDFFIENESHKIYLNEVNTIPGFTSISMYPKLWEASGLQYTDLLDELIRLAIQRRFSYNYG